MRDQPFMSVTHSVVNRQLERLVAESDPRAWKETLAVLCTYATTDEFAALCDALAARLRGPGRDERSATLCYICAGNVDRTVQIWLEQVGSVPVCGCARADACVGVRRGV